jgi:hypothetical protein
MQVSASLLVGASPVVDVTKRKRKRPFCTTKEVLPAKQPRTLFAYGFHKDISLTNFVVRLDNSVVSSLQPETPKSTLRCLRCPFTTSHGPALTSHMTTHRILGMDFVPTDQHRLDGLDATFTMPSIRFPGIPSDVICCVYDMIQHLEEMQPRVRKPRKEGSKGSCLRKPHTASFKMRVLTALAQKRRYCPNMADTRVAERYGINKSLLTRWRAQEAEIFKDAKSRSRRNTTRKQQKRTSKYKLTEDALLAEFDTAREAGKRCGPRWLIRNARRLIKDFCPVLLPSIHNRLAAC